jgi:uncharacterized protein
MSRQDVEVVRTGFEAWSSGDLERLLGLIHPEIEWSVRPDLPDAGVYRGHAELLQLFDRFEEVLEDQWFEPQEFIEARGCVIVPLHWGGRGRASGLEVVERQGETWVFTVEDGLVSRVTEYRRKDEALEAVGLPQ